MSLLNEDYNLNKIGPGFEAFKLKANAKQIYTILQNGLLESTKLFWDNQNFTPSELASAVGTDGAELFKLHSAAITALETAIPGSTQEIISYIKPHTINQDGSVTIL